MGHELNTSLKGGSGFSPDGYETTGSFGTGKASNVKREIHAVSKCLDFYMWDLQSHSSDGLIGSIQ